MFNGNNQKVVKKYIKVLADAELKLREIPTRLFDTPVIGLNTEESKELAFLLWRTQDITEALQKLQARITGSLGKV